MVNKIADKKLVDVSSPQDDLGEMTEKWKRALADYHNLEKRTEEERKVLVLLLTQQVLRSFLPLYDSLKKAQEVTPSEGNQALLSQILEILGQFGVRLMDSEDMNFDPEKHEALEVVIAEEDNRVVEILRDGFIINGSFVLRPAQVIVSKKGENNV